MITPKNLLQYSKEARTVNLASFILYLTLQELNLTNLIN